MSRVMVTGAAGFIGRHIDAALVGHQVLRLGRSAAPGRGWIRIDLAACSTEELAEQIAGFAPDAVINCVGAIEGDARDMASANVLAVATLVEALAQAAPNSRLVQVGSSAEYGPTAGRQPVDEDSPALPISNYGVTKLAATQLVLGATSTGSVDGMVLRLFNPVGAGMSDATLPGRAARTFREALRLGEGQASFGPLTAVRDFIDVRDAADAVVAAAFIAEPADRLINCGSGSPTRSRDLVSALARIARYDGDIREERSGSARSPGVAWQTADIRRSTRVLGWSTKRTVDDALQALWDGPG